MQSQMAPVVADPPSNDPNNSSSSSDAEEYFKKCNPDYLSLGLSFHTGDVLEDLVNWSYPSAGSVEKLATEILETMLRGAIKKIVAFGYSEEEVNNAVLWTGSCCGDKDVVSNVIDNAPLFIKNAIKSHPLTRYFVNLEKMAHRVVWDLAYHLHKSKPFLSVADAYWLLILGDMGFPGACSSGETSSPKLEIKTLKITKTETIDEITKTPIVDKTETIGINTEAPTKPVSEKDAKLVRLMWRYGALREKVGAWNKWAREIVMQATTRLRKDRVELRAVREWRESSEQARREEEVIRDTMAMRMWAQTEKGLLEGESDRLRREIEAARAAAGEAEERVQEGVRREKEREERGRAWQREKDVFREEIEGEKKKGGRLDKEVKVAQDRRNQLEARLKQDQNAKDKLLKKANSIRKERGEVEVSAEKEEQALQANAEANVKKYKYDIEKLQKEISELRLKKDASTIAALREGLKKLSPEEAHIRNPSRHVISNIDYDDVVDLKRDRECVMCLSEEKTVFFLPCAHQVLCKACNEIHEKQGGKDCPCCRTVIQERICGRYASE